MFQWNSQTLKVFQLFFLFYCIQSSTDSACDIQVGIYFNGELGNENLIINFRKKSLINSQIDLVYEFMHRLIYEINHK